MKLQKITKDKSRKQYRYIVCGGHANTFPDSFPFAQKESLGTKLNVEKCKKNVRKKHGGIGSHSTDPRRERKKVQETILPLFEYL